MMTFAASLPWGDWEFWVVTAAAAGASAWIFRDVRPIPFLVRRRERRRTERRATLTISAKHPPSDKR